MKSSTSNLCKFLEAPSYGFLRNGVFYRPTQREIFREFFSRLNVFRDRKYWLPVLSWTAASLLAVPFFIFLFKFFTWPLFILGFIYSMVCLGSHGTFWLHRYSTHRAFQFSHPFWRFICRNLVLKIIPEETYVISHHVHHQFPERAGDPYNVHGGGLYCFLADVNHQLIARDLNEKDYSQLCKLMSHTGVRLNSYEQYKKWGSLCHPIRAISHFVLNWAFWYGVLFMIGGHALATAIFGMSVIWAFGVRTYNYDGHGRGKDRRKPGSDFNTADWSVNQVWPGYVAGEWHNNHHLYPNGARSGFQPYQLDLPWFLIRSLKAIGAIKTYKDFKTDFYRDYYLPYVSQQTQKFPEKLKDLKTV